MSLAEDRKRTRERVRQYRCGAPTKRRCRKCDAYLSRYAEDHETLCAVCFQNHATHEDYVVFEELRETGLAKHPDYCINGHNLTTHGKVMNAGGGRTTRRCNECRRLNQIEYQRRRRARQV